MSIEPAVISPHHSSIYENPVLLHVESAVGKEYVMLASSHGLHMGLHMEWLMATCSRGICFNVSAV